MVGAMHVLFPSRSLVILPYGLLSFHTILDGELTTPTLYMCEHLAVVPAMYQCI